MTGNKKVCRYIYIFLFNKNVTKSRFVSKFHGYYKMYQRYYYYEYIHNLFS